MMEYRPFVWYTISAENPPPEGIRVLVFSPSDNMVMRLRMMDSEFVRFCPDATHWMRLGEPPV